MKKHLTKRQILEMADPGLSSRGNRSALESHVSSCMECSDRIDSVRGLLSPRYRDTVMPSPELRERVITSFRSFSAEKSHSRGRALFPWTLPFPARPVAAAATLALFLAAGLFFYNMITPAQDPISLTMKSVSGGVSCGKIPMKPMSMIPAGSDVSVQDSSWCEIAHGSSVSVKIFGKSSLLVEHASRESRAGSVYLRFRLYSGTLISSVKHDPVPVEYSYITPAAIINSAGTVLLITAHPNSTRVLVLEGSCKLNSTRTGEEVRTSAGYLYRIEEGISERPATSDDLRMYRSLIARTRVRAGALLHKEDRPVPGTADKPVKTGSSGLKNDTDSSREALRERRELLKSRREIRESEKEIRRAGQDLKQTRH